MDADLPRSTPEVFDIVPNTLSAQPRKNLAEISKMITQITTGEVFGNDAPWMVAVEEYLRAAIKQLSDWFLDVADVVDAETHYHAHEFLDVAVQPKPIYISPNEVYSMHSLLMKHLDALVCPLMFSDNFSYTACHTQAPQRDDPLRVILHELDGVPNFRMDGETDELHNARDRAITLELTNRFAVVEGPPDLIFALHLLNDFHRPPR